MVECKLPKPRVIMEDTEQLLLALHDMAGDFKT